MPSSVPIDEKEEEEDEAIPTGTGGVGRVKGGGRGWF